MFSRCGSIDLVMERGRWRRCSIAYIYRVEGAAHLLRLALHEETVAKLGFFESLWTAAKPIDSIVAHLAIGLQMSKLTCSEIFS